MTGGGPDPGNSGGGPLGSETEQSTPRSELLAFLQADPLDVYDALDGAEREYVETRRESLRADAPPAGELDVSEAPRERLLKAAAVDSCREKYGSMAVLFHLTSDDVDVGIDKLPEGVPASVVDIDRETLAPVMSVLADLSESQHERLEQLGVYPADD